MYQQPSRPPPQPVPTYSQFAQPQFHAQQTAPPIALQPPPSLVQHQHQHQYQHQPIHAHATYNPHPHVASADITPRQQYQQVLVASPRQLVQQQYYSQAGAAVAATSHPQRQLPLVKEHRSISGHAGSGGAPTAPFALGSPALAAVLRAQPGTIIRPPIVLSSPGLARMSASGNMRPIFIAAGPPSIIKNPSRTKLLLERPVPHINIKQRTNTLLADFWSADLDVSKEGKVVMLSERAKSSSEWRKKTPKQPGIVVGIDFGNTFTGVSYAHQNDGEMIDIVKWPKHLNAYSKVPTVSLYKTNEDKSLVEWGSSALASYKRSRTDRVLIRNYKLELFDQGARGRLEHGLHLTDVFTQYIHSIHRYLIEEVNKTQVLSAASVPIHYCITVPQAWTLPTRELILRCYVEASVILQTPAPNMTVITEAEAAATYCREHCVEFESLKDGDVFMVCDAGGLTTHVTAFRVDDALGVRQFMRLSSSHAEDCGSIMLDSKFKELVLQRLAGLDLDAKPQRQKAFETLLEGFEEIKSQFDANSRDEVKHILVPMGLDVSELDPTPSWMEDEYMALSGQELCQVVFDPVVEKVQSLVSEQSKVHPSCACLFLVGGFGANKYLHRQLLQSALDAEEARMADNSNGGVIQSVVMVQKAELAVARGAVIYGLKSAAQQNKAFL